MNAPKINPTQNEPEISAEQFIPDHTFFYVSKGTLRCYDGNKYYTFTTGEYGLARKNRLARYTTVKAGDQFESIIFCLDQNLIKDFQQRHKVKVERFNVSDTFILIEPTAIISDFIRSLAPYMDSSGKIDEPYEDVKYEELLIILLQNQPSLSGVFFDDSRPEKINLEEFMNRNFIFNARIERFAYLTGRSLSAFKRDFKLIFDETPNRWLVKKRLQEAYFLIDKKNKKASEIYLELGFEDLSHFSFAFKSMFGIRPTDLKRNYI